MMFQAVCCGLVLGLVIGTASAQAGPPKDIQQHGKAAREAMKHLSAMKDGGA